MPQRRLDPDRGELQHPIALGRRAHALVPALEQLLHAPAIRGQRPAQKPRGASIRVDRPVEPQNGACVRPCVGAQVAPAELGVEIRGVNGQTCYPGRERAQAIVIHGVGCVARGVVGLRAAGREEEKRPLPVLAQAVIVAAREARARR